MAALAVGDDRGPVTVRELLGLALPAALGSILHLAFRPIDQYFVADLGKEAQGALGATTFVVILAYATFLLVSAGAGPLMARATGARRPDERRSILGAALIGTSTVAVGLAFAGLLFADGIAALLGLHGEMGRMASTYLRVLFVTGLANAFAPLVDSCFHAMGDTRLPLVLRALAISINVVLTPLFIRQFGWGVAGAALGSTLAELVVVGIGLTVLVRRVGLRREDLRADQLARIVRLGTPVASSTAMYAGVYWVLLAVAISPLGPAVTAGLGIGFNVLESFSWPAFWGAAVAVSSVVGRRLGAKQPEEAWRAARMVFGPAVAAGVVASLVFVLGGPTLVGLWAADPDVYREALTYAVVLAWSQPFVAVEAWAEGVLEGAGDTRKVFWGSVPFNVARIPLAWALAFPLGLGAAGVWWAINVTSLGKALAKGAMVAHGGWSRLEV
jgi:MATE family multidrug resistance protein